MNSKIIKDIAAITVLVLALDFMYISATRNMFEVQIADVQRVALQMRPLGGILCYILLVFGLYYFIVREHRPVFDAFLLGLVIYGVYETTSYALLKKWKWNIVLMDTLWGGILFALTTFITYKVV
uniref:DUF2177 family protein n=1 Tax=viral metagenome TaxID=1070528 RepID=A0A6C0ET49_9ZZZZ